MKVFISLIFLISLIFIGYGLKGNFNKIFKENGLNNQTIIEPTKAYRPNTYGNEKVYVVSVSDVTGKKIDFINCFNVIAKVYDLSEQYFLYLDRDVALDKSSYIIYFLDIFDYSKYIGKTIKYGNYQLKIEKEANNLIPYLIDPKYCESDSNCVGMENLCNIGSYNQYKTTAINNCGKQIIGVEGYSDDKIKEITKGCSVYDPVKKRNFEVSFSKAKCVNNRCKAMDMKITCISN